MKGLFRYPEQTFTGANFGSRAALLAPSHLPATWRLRT